MSTQTDEQQIRALIDTWAEASRDGDLTALLNLTTEDVVFLTAGNIPMRRQDFAAGFKSMMQAISIEARSDVQEITINGRCCGLLEST